MNKLNINGQAIRGLGGHQVTKTEETNHITTHANLVTAADIVSPKSNLSSMAGKVF